MAAIRRPEHQNFAVEAASLDQTHGLPEKDIQYI